MESRQALGLRRKSWLLLMAEKGFNEKKNMTMPGPAHSFFPRWLGLMINDLEKDLMMVGRRQSSFFKILREIMDL